METGPCGLPVWAVSVLTDGHPDAGVAPGYTAAALVCHGGRVEAQPRGDGVPRPSPGVAWGAQGSRGRGFGPEASLQGTELREAGQSVPTPTETQLPPVRLR